MKIKDYQISELNKLIFGLDSKNYFICQSHPVPELKNDFYYLTSLDSDFDNRTEKKQTIDNQMGYEISNKGKRIILTA